VREGKPRTHHVESECSTAAVSLLGGFKDGPRSEEVDDSGGPNDSAFGSLNGD
jgi:hypothetical protein